MRTRREAVIVATARTALAKSFRGSFNLTRPDDMAAECIKQVLRKTPLLDPQEIDDVVMGTGFPEGPQGFNVGRNVAAMAGLPVTVAGQTVSRFCSSGLRRSPPPHGRKRGRRGGVGGGPSRSPCSRTVQQEQPVQPLALEHYRHPCPWASMAKSWPIA
jgi:hypothetical protein